MAYFIKTTWRKTYTKMLVKADTADEAISEDGEYIGVVDGDDEGAPELAGPFETDQEALQQDAAYTEYH